MKAPQYTDNKGVGYDINRTGDGSWSVWELGNSGWTWKGTLCSYSLAMSFMTWLGNFKEESNE